VAGFTGDDPDEQPQGEKDGTPRPDQPALRHACRTRMQRVSPWAMIGSRIVLRRVDLFVSSPVNDGRLRRADNPNGTWSPTGLSACSCSRRLGRSADYCTRLNQLSNDSGH
jgi:hypothetical protein